jgi:DNA-binding MarR family transcriptional regulator
LKDKTNNLDLVILPDLIGYHVRLAQVAIFRDFVAALRDFEMTPTHFGTLVIVNNNPGIKQTDLASAIQIDRSTVVPLIDKLESEGLVTRERLTNDRRTNALRITDNGQRLLERLIPMVRAHEQHVFKNLTKDEQNKVIRLLNKIY